MKFFLSIAILVVTLALPNAAVFAQDLAGAAGCDGPTCTACNVVSLANAVINWLIAFLTLVFAVIAVIAGFGLVSSAGNQSALDAAKSKFTNAIIGFIIILSAWLVVDTIFRGLVSSDGIVPNASRSGGLFWGEIECQVQNEPQAASRQLISLDGYMAGTDGDTPPTVATPSGPVTITPSGTSCFNGPDGQEGTSDDVCIATNSVSGGAYNLPDGSRLGYTAPGGYIGPDMIAQNPQISPNLRLCDVTNCDAARRSGDYVYIDPFMVAQLDSIYNDLGGLSVNSGYRSPAYNQSVGGATHSRHQYGDAVDIAVTPSNTEADIMRSCAARGATNIYTYASGRHVHCDWRGATRQ